MAGGSRLAIRARHQPGNPLVQEGQRIVDNREFPVGLRHLLRALVYFRFHPLGAALKLMCEFLLGAARLPETDKFGNVLHTMDDMREFPVRDRTRAS